MCTSYKHKLRWKGKTSDFSPFIDWPVLQEKGTNISLAWSSQGERSRGWEPAVSSTSFRGIRTCWDPLEHSQGRGAAIKPGGETTREGWEGEAVSLRGACSGLLKQKGTAGTPPRKKSSFNPHHQDRCSRQLPYPNSVKILCFIGVTEISLIVSLC